MKQLCVFLSLVVLTSFTQPKKESEFIVKVVNIPSVEGKVSLLVFNDAEGFPEKKERAVLEKTVDVVAKEMSINLGDLPYGKYAIAILHDKNANKALDKNFIGIPKEAFGFSNITQIIFSTPSFEEAAVTFNSENKSTEIKLLELI